VDFFTKSLERSPTTGNKTDVFGVASHLAFVCELNSTRASDGQAIAPSSPCGSSSHRPWNGALRAVLGRAECECEGAWRMNSRVHGSQHGVRMVVGCVRSLAVRREAPRAAGSAGLSDGWWWGCGMCAAKKAEPLRVLGPPGHSAMSEISRAHRPVAAKSRGKSVVCGQRGGAESVGCSVERARERARGRECAPNDDGGAHLTAGTHLHSKQTRFIFYIYIYCPDLCPPQTAPAAVPLFHYTMATIIYYKNLDYDMLPTAKKRRVDCGAAPSDDGSPSVASNAGSSSASFRSYHSVDSSSVTSANCSSDDGSPVIYAGAFSPSSTTTAAVARHAPPDDDVRECTPLSHNTYNRSRQLEHQQSAPSSRRQKSRPNRASLYQVPDKQLLLDTLKRYFKFESFRENQFEAVNATCAGHDTLILMPTGGGKSICYQLPAIISEGITIVVSPLKSLIADQVHRMRTLNVKTSALSGETSDADAESIIWDLRQELPEHKLLFVTPEKISASGSLMSIFNQLHERNLLARFVIDEAHCVSMWGSDFRPDYRKLNKLREQYPDVPIMALTATAPPDVRDDILTQLKMDKTKAKVFIQSFNRPNLKFEVRNKTKGCLSDICKMIRANFAKQCGIIYCLSRNDCELTAAGLREQGITSAPYHAGLPDQQRQRVFSAWSRGTFQVVCATIAFGMGIDKADVRFVIHYSMPKSIEGYYQEAGRAGRDGKFASCILYFSKSDLYRMKSMLSKTGFGRKVEDKNRDHVNLQHMVDYVDNKSECRRSIMLRYLGEEFDSRQCISHLKTACDNCLARKNMN
jgi:RecQ family ATP-dependent DNA helicase